MNMMLYDVYSCLLNKYMFPFLSACKIRKQTILKLP